MWCCRCDLFLSFNATKKNSVVELTWDVIKDNAIKDFELTYSYDGNNFTSFGFIKQNEFAAEENNSRIYKFSQNDQHDGYIFYRIKMNDYNDRNISSSIIKINVAYFDQRVLSVYPNPSAGKFFYEQKFPAGIFQQFCSILQDRK